MIERVSGISLSLAPYLITKRKLMMKAKRNKHMMLPLLGLLLVVVAGKCCCLCISVENRANVQPHVFFFIYLIFNALLSPSTPNVSGNNLRGSGNRRLYPATCRRRDPCKCPPNFRPLNCPNDDRPHPTCRMDDPCMCPGSLRPHYCFLRNGGQRRRRRRGDNENGVRRRRNGPY